MPQTPVAGKTTASKKPYSQNKKTKQTPSTQQQSPTAMQAPNSQASTPTEPFMLELNCKVEGDDAPFPVKILSSESVGSLKDVIHPKINTEESVKPKDLTLKLVCVSGRATRGASTEEVDKLSEISLRSLESLDPLKRVSAYFPDKNAAAEGLIHILVVLPQQASGALLLVKRRVSDDNDDDGARKKAKLLRLSDLKDQNIKISTQTYNHRFYDRKNFIKLVAPSIASNYNSRGMTDHKRHRAFLVPGGSGIGKSRAGYELQNLVAHAKEFGIQYNIKSEELDAFKIALDNACYLYVNLNNGCAYNENLDEPYDGGVRIGVRLAVVAGLGGKSLGHTVETCDAWTFSIKEVVKRILEQRFSTTGRTPEAIIIHIDEFQQYISMAQSMGNRSWEAARQHFKGMLQAIYGIMADADLNNSFRFFIIPVVTGTSGIDLHYLHSDFVKVLVNLTPLDYKSAISMYNDKYGDSPLSNEVMHQNHFRIALSDTGYVPRYIDFFLKPISLSRDIDWGNLLFDEVTQGYSQASSFASNQLARTDLRTIISLGLIKIAITRDTLLPSGKTVGEVETTGMIFLASANLMDKDYVVISMPFVQLKMLNRKLTRPIIPDDKLVIPTKDNPWSWSDFENLLGYYHRALVDAIINTDRDVMNVMVNISRLTALLEKKSSVGSKEEQDNINNNLYAKELALAGMKARIYRSLSQVFRSAKGSRSLLNHLVKLEELEVFEEKFKCIVEKTDVIPFVEKIFCKNCDEEGVEREKGIFHCLDGTANIDYRWIMESKQGKSVLILLQCKHSKLDTTNRKFNHCDLKTWYDLIVHSASEFTHLYRVVVVIVTNRLYNNPYMMSEGYRTDKYGEDGISDMPDLLLIDESCLAEYLSPAFAYRGLLTIPDDLQAEQILTASSSNLNE
ncbi:hypothetical protein BGZ76_002903 [Entomortierella beljakovae]|nr:hypothetical protein BGZ76_002903 [Entomortierella beljakovae]